MKVERGGDALGCIDRARERKGDGGKRDDGRALKGDFYKGEKYLLQETQMSTPRLVPQLTTTFI